MQNMPARSWSKPALAALLVTTACAAAAQNRSSGPAPASASEAVLLPVTDVLADALSCRIGDDLYARLIEALRNERPQDFSQTYRQYSAPPMDVYQLEYPVQAWGNESDAIVIGENRVMMAVAGALDEVTQELEHALEQSSESPLSGALDDQHALVIFSATQPGLEGRVLVGCEYRIPGVSLLDDPEDAWRKKPVLRRGTSTEE